jgi:hypothetical protein
MSNKIDSLDKKIRGNGVPGIDDRLSHVEEDVKKHKTSLYDKDSGVVPFVAKSKWSFHLMAIMMGATGSILTLIALFATTPFWNALHKMILGK